MKCKQCSKSTPTLRRGWCTSCYRANSYPLEVFSDEQLLKELGQRIANGKIQTDWESTYGDSEGCTSLYLGKWNKRTMTLYLYDGEVKKEVSHV
ncbi:hypothetical protein [endosymbiont GvMRE of Glomus versiforme]|uniref:hypothetical protein n=1 Tax=endosymbiont GvMRE of Glomus versiforme TaxID=2039283 RepID=UPI000ED2992F|nr:hypothetical protein [endosymbiont GvMRE of Glomus versiforme]RHZ36688.1 hypothetical protein GvMRE_I2g571 [endosymbiont GvMRE of Glomus versiforme]